MSVGIFKGNHKKAVILGIGLLALWIVLFWSHNYGDCLITTSHGINFWTLLFNGKFFNFYSDNIVACGNQWYPLNEGCAYNILVYLVFAIWNIPLALLMNFTDVDVMNNILCLGWAKLLPALCLIIIALVMWRILSRMNMRNDRKWLSVYLFLSSSFALSSTLINSQYDSIGLVFQMLGLMAYMEDDSKGFVIWFGLAVCFKFFALLVFIPLLLFKQKNILRIVLNVLLAILPYVLTTLPFMLLRQGAAPGQNLTKDLLILMFNNMELTDVFDWFFIVYGALMIICYAGKPKRTLEDKRFILSICFCAYATFFAFVNTHPYWCVLLAPYMALLIATTSGQLSLCILLETIGTFFLTVKNMFLYTWTFFGNTMKTMIWGILTPTRATDRYNSVENLILTMPQHILLNKIIIVGARSAFLLAAIVIAYLCYPRKSNELTDSTDTIPYDALFLRMFAVGAISLVPVVSLFI